LNSIGTRSITALGPVDIAEVRKWRGFTVASGSGSHLSSRNIFTDSAVVGRRRW
jgi:hypothetical protein